MREHEDVSQSDLARELGVQQATVNRWENDAKSPTDENLLALAALLGVTPGWLKFGQEPKFPPAETQPNVKTARRVN